MAKGHEHKWVREYVCHREAEYRCEACGEYRVMPASREKEKSWDGDKKRARGKGSKYDWE